MDKFFAVLFWKSLRRLINKSKNSWLSVTASMFAATLFLFLQSFMNLINSTEDNLYKLKYEEFVETFKLKEIFPQRGSIDIVNLYQKLTKKAEKRIWAIGMTNRHFIDQHKDSITKALQNHNIDIVIAFWNPTSTIESIINGKQKKHNMLDIQYALEDAASSNTNWEDSIKERQRKFKNHIEENSPLKGELRIVDLSHPTNFTCFVIDDELFFFPFLSGPESTNDPTIHCNITDGIGKRIYDHFDRVLNGNFIVDTVYHRKADENITDRL
jgi:hypothetical protein